MLTARMLNKVLGIRHSRSIGKKDTAHVEDRGMLMAVGDKIQSREGRNEIGSHSNKAREARASNNVALLLSAAKDAANLSTVNNRNSGSQAHSQFHEP